MERLYTSLHSEHFLNEEESEEDHSPLFEKQNSFNKKINKSSTNESNAMVSIHNQSDVIELFEKHPSVSSSKNSGASGRRRGTESNLNQEYERESNDIDLGE